MREALYGWMKQLAVFYIFLTAVMNFLPDEKYARYIRYFTGMLLILLVLGPLLDILHLKDVLQERFWEETIREQREEFLGAEDLQNTYLYKAYEQEIALQIQRKLEELKVAAQVKVALQPKEQSAIEKITVITAEEGPQQKKEAVQDGLEEAYGVQRENVVFLVEKDGEATVDDSSFGRNSFGSDSDADR